MKLSVIIVNYNVCHFLEQCLYTVLRACKGLDAEVIVFDNHSSDGSLPFLEPLFPGVRFIASQENLGFARANNKALTLAKGEWVLFLNPDTLLPEDCLHLALEFADKKPLLGGLGIKMVDGSGAFLPESKRSFPAPLTSLFKLAGLSAAMPKSPVFARYHLGHLSAGQNHEVDVLAGAFMMVRKQVLDKAGAFDEQFFMYGEDIDLSYRIQQAGWQNWYFAESSIIHFKGESTKKGSLNYVRMFYQAMDIFVRKHYHGGKAFFFRFFIRLAIALRAFASAAGQFIRRAGLPLIDSFVTVATIIIVYALWYQYVRPDIIPEPWVKNVAIPLFTVVFIGASALAGLYDWWYKPWRTFRAMMAAVVFLLAVYSLLPEAYRFSRAIIFISGLSAALLILVFRRLLALAGWKVPEDEDNEYRQTLICGAEADCEKAARMMEAGGLADRILGSFEVDGNSQSAALTLDSINSLYKSNPFRELVFCTGGHLTMKMVMEFISRSKLPLRYKFLAGGSQSIVGSESKETAGSVLSPMAAYHLSKPWHRRNKRLFDLALAMMLLLTSPLALLFVKNGRRLPARCIQVLAGKKTWVGYANTITTVLPKIRNGFLAPNGSPVAASKEPGNPYLQALDERYARHYDWSTDMALVIGHFRNLAG